MLYGHKQSIFHPVWPVIKMLSVNLVARKVCLLEMCQYVKYMSMVTLTYCLLPFVQYICTNTVRIALLTIQFCSSMVFFGACCGCYSPEVRMTLSTVYM
jgi:hypothetical protein